MMMLLGAATHTEIELYLLMSLLFMRALAKWAKLD
jgi:hypothetical protein